MAKIDIVDLKAFKEFVQNLNRESYTKLIQNGLPTHGVPTIYEAQKDEDQKKPIKESEIAKKSDVAEDSDLCKICLDNELDVLVMPCKHLCLCSECADMIKNKGQNCPMCRSAVDELIKVFKC